MKIVRNNKLFESSSTEPVITVGVNIFTNESTNIYIHRIIPYCRVLRNIIAEYNKEHSLADVKCSVIGTVFAKNITQNTNESFDIYSVDVLTDKRFIKPKLLGIELDFKGDFVSMEDTVYAMDLLMAIMSRFSYNTEKVKVGSESIESVNLISRFPSSNKLNKNNIMTCYSAFNKNVNGCESAKTAFSNYCKYDGMSDDARKIFEAIGYNFNKHAIFITDEEIGTDVKICLRVHITDKVTDYEIEYVCKVFEELVYPTCPSEKMSFTIIIEGFLVAEKEHPEWIAKPENTILIYHLVNYTNISSEEYLKPIKSMK